MNIATIVATISVAVILFLAIRYIVREKLKGSKCVGCPYAENCHGNKATNCEGNKATNCE